MVACRVVRGGKLIGLLKDCPVDPSNGKLVVVFHGQVPDAVVDVSGWASGRSGGVGVREVQDREEKRREEKRREEKKGREEKSKAEKDRTGQRREKHQRAPKSSAV